jgi:hypothetical protein
MIRIDTIEEGMLAEVERLARGPASIDLLEFEIVLQEQYRATQAAVHKITRSLSLSGKFSSDMKGDKWEGEITYGGTSFGVYNPVDYAEYERERGGGHDFLKPAEALSDGYVEAMNAFFRG